MKMREKMTTAPTVKTPTFSRPDPVAQIDKKMKRKNRDAIMRTSLGKGVATGGRLGSLLSSGRTVREVILGESDDQ